MRKFFPVLFFTLLILGACSPTNGQSMRAGTPAPNFTLPKLKGGSVVLSELTARKAVILDFWASWCPYCAKAIPQLNKLQAKNKNKIEVIGINVGENRAKAERFARQKGIAYLTALDPDRRVAKSYKIVGIPTVVYIDKGGKILYYGHSVEEMRRKTGL